MNGDTYTKESVTIVPLLQKNSVIPEADLPTTEIIEPKNVGQMRGRARLNNEKALDSKAFKSYFLCPLQGSNLRPID